MLESSISPVWSWFLRLGAVGQPAVPFMADGPHIIEQQRGIYSLPTLGDKEELICVKWHKLLHCSMLSILYAALRLIGWQG